MATPVTIIPSGGVVNRQGKLDNPLGSFRSLSNCRLVQGGGALEQTPGWLASNTYTAGTYYNAGSQAEPADSSSALYVSLSGLVFQAGRYAARINAAATQVQVVKQTAYPSGGTAIKHCLLVINNYAALAITLGLALDVEIEAGGTTFKWRKNGGAYVTAQPCSLTGTSIDGGNATVYFLAATGLNPGDVWTWTRTDWFDETSGPALAYDWSYSVYASQVYFVDYSGRVMLFENGGVRSVGYQPVYGTHVEIFDGHLYVANYSPTIFTTTFSSVSGNSDLSNFDCFFATDVNEVDFFFIPAGVLEGDYRPTNKICGYFKKENILYIFTTSAIWTNQYLGLPRVNFYQFYVTFATSPNAAQPILGNSGVYIVSTGGLYFFNGAELTRISDDLFNVTEYITPFSVSFPTFVTVMVNLLWGGYDNLRGEVYFYTNATNHNAAGCVGFYVYQERTRSWYFRSMSVPTVVVKTMAAVLGRIFIPISLSTAAENTSYAAFGAGVPDAGGGLYQVPTIETQDLDFAAVQTVYEINELYLDAYYAIAADPFANTGVLIDVSVRNYAAAAVTYASAVATWVSTNTNGELAYRGSSRIFRFRFRVATASGKESRAFIFNRFVMNVLNLDKDQVRR